MIEALKNTFGGGFRKECIVNSERINDDIYILTLHIDGKEKLVVYSSKTYDVTDFDDYLAARTTHEDIVNEEEI